MSKHNLQSTKKLVISLVILFIIITTLTITVIKKNRTKLNDKNQLSSKMNMVATTNTWFNSAYSFPSEPLFVNPGSFKVTRQGLEIGIPQVTVTPKTVFASHLARCFLNDKSKLISDSKIKGYGDWNLDLELLTTNNNKWNLSLTQGLPFVYITKMKGINLSCSNASITKVNSDYLITFSDIPEALLLQLDFDKEKNLVTPIITNNQIKTEADIEKVRIAILPTKEESIVQLFSQTAWNPVINTTVEFSKKDKVLSTQYNFETENNSPLLITLYPHHQTNVPKLNLTYNSLLGYLVLAKANNFTSKTRVPKLPLNFKTIKNPDYVKEIKKQIKLDTQTYLTTKAPEGVYFKATWLGGLTTLLQLADNYKLENEKKLLFTRLKEELLKDVTNFQYLDDKKMLVSKNPEFGNEKGNDHHFHYGYYIRAAAVLIKEDPKLIKKLTPTIEEMILDIANSDRSNSRYPFLRYYSPYEGHSWADANAKFADGNNQESSSEALNAWYAIKIWGETTKNKKTELLGEWLFSQELNGTLKYWFDTNDFNLLGYKHQIFSIVWGGKKDFATWFSNQKMHIYGIQFLPITPASDYLGEVKNFEKKKLDLNSGENILEHEWADLYLAFLAYNNPREALELLPKVNSTEGMKIRSLLLQVVYQNLE